MKLPGGEKDIHGSDNRLIEIFLDPESQFQARAALGLAGMGQIGATRSAKLLASDDPRGRARGVQLLSLMPGPVAKASLHKALKDKDEIVRHLARRALEATPGGKSSPVSGGRRR